jgi:iron complex outermembrane receptor protein
LWATYEPQEGDLRGLKLGAGVVARSQREGDNQNSYQLPGYALLNLMTGYSWNVGPSKLSLQLNADNVLNKTYYNPAGSPSRFYVFAAPRTVLGMIKMELW